MEQETPISRPGKYSNDTLRRVVIAVKTTVMCLKFCVTTKISALFIISRLYV